MLLLQFLLILEAVSSPWDAFNWDDDRETPVNFENIFDASLNESLKGNIGARTIRKLL